MGKTEEKKNVPMMYRDILNTLLINYGRMVYTLLLSDSKSVGGCLGYPQAIDILYVRHYHLGNSSLSFASATVSNGDPRGFSFFVHKSCIL